VETAARLFGVIAPEEGGARWRRHLAFLDRNAYASLSYVNDWLEAFRQSPELDVRARNVVDLVDLAAAAREARQVDLVVVLHSAAGDEMNTVRRLVGPLRRRGGMLVQFFGNEYTLLPEKIAFARDVRADFIASQLPPAASGWLYAACDGSKILHAPPALNPARFFPNGAVRTVDIGFRGDLYPPSIGDDERNQLLLWARDKAVAQGLTVDVEFSRLPAHDWNDFLNRCRGIVGAEAGTRYLQRDNRGERLARRWLRQNPSADVAEVARRFFAENGNDVSGKAISSRHFEAAGTRTCQILLEGHYNGILEPSVHYLALRRDWSNLDSVIERFRDESVREALVDRAYRHVLGAHTYAHRVAEILAAVHGLRESQ
jgi:hypothetical protein